MSLPNEYSVVCDSCNGYNISPVVCVECLKEWIRKARKKDVDYVGEYIEAKLDSLSD